MLWWILDMVSPQLIPHPSPGSHRCCRCWSRCGMPCLLLTIEPELKANNCKTIQPGAGILWFKFDWEPWAHHWPSPCKYELVTEREIRGAFVGNHNIYTCEGRMWTAWIPVKAECDSNSQSSFLWCCRFSCSHIGVCVWASEKAIECVWWHILCW